MKKHNRWQARVDDEGRLVLPPGLARSFGLRPGDSLLVQQNHDRLALTRSVNALTRVNIEVTNQCNLNCQTCMRNAWEEPAGSMSAAVFERILEGIRQLPAPPLVFFGGFGEPLYHPRIFDMLQAAKQAGLRVELITNATLLDEAAAQVLVDLQLDRLWVSLDGASPDCYADIRLGARLPGVLDNMRRLFRLRSQAQSPYPQIGVAFVAMRRNIHDLPELIRISESFGAKSFSISNVLAHTETLRREMLYQRSMYDSPPMQQDVLPFVSFPRIDASSSTLPVLEAILKASYPNNLGLFDAASRADACPFLTRGSVSIRWDGQVSPCLPLMHTHQAYLDDRLRLSREYTIGSVAKQSLPDIWHCPEYTEFRRRLQAFDFSPCVICNSCEMASDNNEDCFGNAFPTCGGCLWAQGIVQCP